MKPIKILFATMALALVVLGTGQGIALAQTTTSFAPLPPVCATLNSSIGYGSTDAATNGGVTALQNFLVAQGYFDSANIGVARFGPLTLQAVQKFQSAQSISSTGFVGPLTRAAISRIWCPTGPTVSSPISLYSLSPSAGVVGDTVSISGSGFTSSNTILFDGSVVARDIPSSSIAIACTDVFPSNCRGGLRQTLTFTVPSSIAPNCPAGSMCPMYMRLVTPGNYDVSVQNANGTSGTLSFTVTDGTSTGNGQTLSVSGLDAPSTLSLGQTGTWTVHVTSGSGSGTLHYGVIWGDEAVNQGNSIMAPGPLTLQTSGTFTHSYERSGTYTPKFTVTDDNGHTVTTSSTITVSPLY